MGAGMLSQEEVDRIIAIIEDPMKFKIPVWFLNRQHDPVHGKFQQVHAQGMAGSLRDDLERLKKIRAHRGLRHYWGLRVRGQHTKTTGVEDVLLVSLRKSKLYNDNKTVLQGR